MSRPFPDGNDRTPNDPCLLLSSASAKKLYEDHNGSPVTGYPDFTHQDVIAFICLKAKEWNWDEVEVYSRQIVLKKKMPGPGGLPMTREKLLSSVAKVESLTTEELFRQSGRTARMVEHAMSEAREGRLVVIVMKDEHQVAIVKKTVNGAPGVSVISYNPRTNEMINWKTLQATGIYHEHRTFIDHDVIYFNHKHLFREASKYDSFTVRGDNIVLVDTRGPKSPVPVAMDREQDNFQRGAVASLFKLNDRNAEIALRIASTQSGSVMNALKKIAAEGFSK